MAFQQTPAPSEYMRALKRGEEVSKDLPKRLSKEEWKKQKDLEEQRKAGNVPAMVDEEGRDINPHIPHYISQAPWYFGNATPTLKHQKTDELLKKRPLTIKEELVDKGLCLRSVATKFRKGACENCGALSHKRKDCLERPRKVGAKHTGEDIAPDEFILADMTLNFEGKRDRWRGFDPSAHKQVVDEFEKLEEARRLIKADQMKQDQVQKGEVVKVSRISATPLTAGKNASVEIACDHSVIWSHSTKQEIELSSNDVKEEDKYAESASMVGTKVDSRQRITVRNLRIREDTAKYLINLDPNSAYYDPKTRSMRDDPRKIKTGTGGMNDDNIFIGENFTRSTGETTDILRALVFAWHAADRGVDTHVNAEPTKLEMLQREYEAEKTRLKGSITQAVIDKYGGVEHFDKPPDELLLSQSEAYVEYSRGGRVLKGNIDDKKLILSRYAEDHYMNNHTAVWGSYWKKGQWGYACCHSFVRNSYCLGVANIHREGDLKAELESSMHVTAAQPPPIDDERAPSREKAAKGNEIVASTTLVSLPNRNVPDAVMPTIVQLTGVPPSDADGAEEAVETEFVSVKPDVPFPHNTKQDGGTETKKRRRQASADSSSSSSSKSADEDMTSSSSSSSEDSEEERRKKKKAKVVRTKDGVSARRRLRAAELREGRQKKSKSESDKLSNEDKQKQLQRSDSSGSETEEVDKRLKRLAPGMDTKKLKDALRQEDARLISGDPGKKFGSIAKYNSRYETKKVTEEEMEAFRIRRVHADDPMAEFVTRKPQQFL